MRLKDKVAIVTGAARGIGRAIALGFADEGAKILINDCRSGQAEEVVQKICASGGKATFVQADVSSLAGHEKLVSAAVSEFRGIDILVNNAGVEFREAFLDSKPETWERTLAVNLKGAYFLSQKAASVMKQSGKGRIINIASIHADVPLRERAIYAISKGGMAMLAKSLALELAQYGITVNAIAPGAILTAMNRESLADAGKRAKLLERIPLGRIGEPEDIVGAAVFLASSESDYVTGTTIYVDGGLLLQ